MIGRWEKILNYVVLTVFSLSAIVPFVYLLTTAFSPSDEAGASFRWPSHFTVENFASAWTTGRFSQYLLSSLIVAVTVVAASTVLSILAAYAFARLDFPGKRILFPLFIVGLLVPLESYIIPLYYTMRGYGLTNTYAALILPQIAQSMAFGVFWMRNYFASMPVSLSEAARLDGASERRLLWSVLVPPARPAILTMILLTFMWTWNDFLLSLVMITSEQYRTAPLGLTFFQSRYLTDYAALSAAALIIAAPVVILYLFLQRHFINGMLSGALKG